VLLIIFMLVTPAAPTALDLPALAEALVGRERPGRARANAPPTLDNDRRISPVQPIG
jgi:hypothetical protein